MSSESGRVIRVEGLAKVYSIRHLVTPSYTTLRESLADGIRRLCRPGNTGGSAKRQDFNALRDVAFDVEPGDRLGIIGRNGAGKSTLLKILSRITPPSAGRVEIRGRLASLLEVGTGFHPELTGRENIYLNGAILGMRRREIARKFDEIVAFADVEKFLDTPVKHFSSGMYVRLAFAVASHLDSDILLVDEVLAVGDGSFQQKCLGRIQDITRQQGRSILFVSHQLSAVAALCNKVVWLNRGQVEFFGLAEKGIERYQESLLSGLEGRSDLAGLDHYGNGKARFTGLSIQPLSRDGAPGPVLRTGGDLSIHLEITAAHPVRSAIVALIVYDSVGNRLIDCNTALKSAFLDLEAGQSARAEFRLRNLLLKPGVYTLGLWLGRTNIEDVDGIQHAAMFHVEMNATTVRHPKVYPGPYQVEFSSNLHLLLGARP